jgi:hypothetical protein
MSIQAGVMNIPFWEESADRRLGIRLPNFRISSAPSTSGNELKQQQKPVAEPKTRPVRLADPLSECSDYEV